MMLVKKIEFSDNIKQNLIKIARTKTKKIVVFDNRIFEEIKKIKPKEIKNKKISPIKKTNIIFIEDENNTYVGYDSLDESFVVVCNRISSNLYLLKSLRYVNKIYEEDIDYSINNFIKFIILSKIKKKINSM